MDALRDAIKKANLSWHKRHTLLAQLKQVEVVARRYGPGMVAIELADIEMKLGVYSS
jgi:hypothetical protein